MSVFDRIFSPVHHVAIDDGGIRISSARAGRYIPFTAITYAGVEFGGRTLLQIDSGGKLESFRIRRDDALSIQADVVPHVRMTPTSRETPAMALRHERPLAQWLEEVDAWASGTYRAAAFDQAGAIALMEDASAPPEARAAIVHALLSTGDELGLEAVARLFVQRALPPVVIVATRLARGGAALVPAWMFDESLAFLDEPDASAARAAIDASITHDGEAHVHELMERCKAKAFAAHAPDPHPKRRHHAPSLGFASAQGVTRFK